MSTAYDTVFSPSYSRTQSSDLAAARSLFRAASGPFLASPLPWFGWALIFPTAALLTPSVAEVFSWPGVILLWSFSILTGGAFELFAVRSRGGLSASSALASWAFRVQANLSLIGVVLSFLCILWGRPGALPAVWLLVLGHSLFMLGGLAFAPLRRAGLVYQLGAILSLLPWVDPLQVLAATTLVANTWVGISIWRRRDSAEVGARVEVD